MANDLKPWRKADNIAHFNLYWLAVQAFPYPAAQRDWIRRFIDEFVVMVGDICQLEPEFLIRETTLVGELQNRFVATGRHHVPMSGLCRNPDEPIKPTPTLEDLKPVQTGEKAFKMSDFAPERCHWLAARRIKEAVRDLGGYGGASIVFHPVDPAAQAPKIPPIMAFKGDPNLGPEAMQGHMNVVSAMRSKFLAESKKVFGKGLESHAQFESLMFVVPRWNAQLYVGARPELVKEWLTVFPIQLVESAEDGGILLASAIPLDDMLKKLNADLEAAGVGYAD